MTVANYRYYLGPWRKRAEPAPTTWTAPDGCAGWLDLATDRRLMLCWTAGALDSAYTLLGQGDCREIASTAVMRDAWKAATGYRPQGERLVDLIWDHLTDGADPAGEQTAKPLVPTRELNLELVLPGHSVVRRERFDIGSHRHANRLRALLQRDLATIRDDSIGGKCKTLDFHRAYLGGLLRQYGIQQADWRSLVPPGWGSDETPRKPGTTIADNFDGTNSATLGKQLSWTEQVGTWANTSNAAAYSGLASGYARANSDLGSSNNYGQIAVTSCGDGGDNYQFGPCCRIPSAGATRYIGRLIRYFDPDWLSIDKSDGAGDPVQLTYAEENSAPSVTLKIDANGSTITLYKGGVQKAQITDTAYSVGVRCGLFAYNTTAGDNFEASDGIAAASKARILGGGLM